MVSLWLGPKGSCHRRVRILQKSCNTKRSAGADLSKLSCSHGLMQTEGAVWGKQYRWQAAIAGDLDRTLHRWVAAKVQTGATSTSPPEPRLAAP